MTLKSNKEKDEGKEIEKENSESAREEFQNSKINKGIFAYGKMCGILHP